MTPPCTPEQKAEWNALHDRMNELSKTKELAEQDALYHLHSHIEAGAMTPGPFGVPSVASLDSYRRACECVHKSAAAWAEWQRLYAESKAHPYTLEVQARQAVSA